MRTRTAFGLLVTALAAVALTASPTSAQEPLEPVTATVTVVHGLRGELVDVYLDGELALEGFQPERVTDPLQVPAGDHEVVLRPAGSSTSETPMTTATVSVVAGANMSLVGHLDPDGKPTVSVYNNDVASLPPGKARFVARNTAEVSDITLVVDGLPAPPLAPEAEYAAVVDPATYRVAVNAPSGGVIVPADDVAVPEGSATIMYLIGSQPDESLIWIGQSIGGLQAPPTAVPTGNSGLAAADDGRGAASTLGVLGGVGAAALLLWFVGGRVARRGQTA